MSKLKNSGTKAFFAHLQKHWLQLLISPLLVNIAIGAFVLSGMVFISIGMLVYPSAVASYENLLPSDIKSINVYINYKWYTMISLVLGLGNQLIGFLDIINGSKNIFNRFKKLTIVTTALTGVAMLGVLLTTWSNPPQLSWSYQDCMVAGVGTFMSICWYYFFGWVLAEK